MSPSLVKVAWGSGSVKDNLLGHHPDREFDGEELGDGWTYMLSRQAEVNREFVGPENRGGAPAIGFRGGNDRKTQQPLDF